MVRSAPFRRFRQLPSLLRCALLVSAVALPAQMHHVDAPERVTRAVGVYEWTGELAKPTAARFVPVSLFIEGRFEDAGLYLARPVPFALQPGDVYTIERAGEPAGEFDVDAARRLAAGPAAANDNPLGAWYGFGKFTPESAPKPAAALRPSAHVGTIQGTGAGGPASGSSGDRPQLRRPSGGSTSSTGSSDSTNTKDSAGTDAGKSSSGSSTSAGGGSTGSSTNSKDSSTSSSDDLDRPTLRRRDPAQDAQRKKEYGSGSGKRNQASVTAAGPQLGDDPDRPTLRRGEAEDGSIPELTGLPAGLHQAIAVSDPNHSETHPFARAWESAAERADTLAALTAIAKPRVLAYLSANHLVASGAPVAEPVVPAAGSPSSTSAAASTAGAPVNGSAEASGPGEASAPRLQRGVPKAYAKPSPAAAEPTATSSGAVGSSTAAATAKPAPSSAAAKVPARPAHVAAHSRTAGAGGQAAPLGLQRGEVTGYMLSYGGLPTFVYSAATAATATGQASGGGAHPVVYVTLVAQRLPSGELQVALGNVTDSTHLDRGPRLRLVDAVDPDDSHRASLLFELRGATSRQFALYRLTTAQAEQTFTTASLE